MQPDDDDTVLSHWPYNYAKGKALATIDQEIVKVRAMSAETLQKLCKAVPSLNSPTQQRAEYVGQLKRLRQRLDNTTDEATGGRYFREDIEELKHGR